MTSTLRPPDDVRADALTRLGLGGGAGRLLVVEDPVVDGRTLRFGFELPGIAAFEETFRFDGVPESPPAPPIAQAIRGAARLTALFAATSYYKTVLPPVVETRFPVTGPAQRLATEVFEEGLGEFAYRVGTSLHGHVRIAADDAGDVAPAAGGLGDRPLVPVGGGKDSIVTLRAVREHFPDLRAFAVNPRGAIDRTIGRAGVPSVTAERTLPDALFDLNDRGALNGHVPITAIVSGIAVIGALLDADRWVVMSNERSADQANLTVDGRTVNHQYAKTAAFERGFAEVIASEVHAELGYLSLLRPAYELTIARAFARAREFHDVFNSCNRAFRLRGETTEWCGDCPKCRFVFLILAPFMDRRDLLTVFGDRDLLDTADQEPGFRDLLGFSDAKPWECVGTFEESQAALGCLAERPEWRDRRLVARLAPQVSGDCGEVARIADRLGPVDLPAPFDGIVHELV